MGKALEEARAKAEVANQINNILIKQSLDGIGNKELSDEEKAKHLNNLKAALDLHDEFNEAHASYREIKAKKKGYFVGWTSATVGALIGVLGPRAYIALKEHLANKN